MLQLPKPEPGKELVIVTGLVDWELFLTEWFSHGGSWGEDHSMEDFLCTTSIDGWNVSFREGVSTTGDLAFSVKDSRITGWCGAGWYSRRSGFQLIRFEDVWITEEEVSFDDLDDLI